MGDAVKNIFTTLIIDKDCSEQFLPLRCPQTGHLDERGTKMAGWSTLRTEYLVRRTSVQHHHIMYTVRGQGWLEFDGARRTLNPGDLFISPAGHAHGYGLKSREWEILWFHLHATDQWRFLRGKKQHVRTGHEMGALCDAVRGYLRETRLVGAKAASAAHHYAQIITLLIERELVGYTNPRTMALQDRFTELWDTVEAGLSRPWSVALMARGMNLSTAQFNRVCQQVCGTKPMAHVRALRMKRAAQLLRDTDLPVNRVADIVGYTDPLAFSTAFRRSTGTCPRTYRRQHAEA